MNEFIEVRELAEALVVLDERGQDVTLLAGGTDVMVQYLRGDIRPAVLLHIANVAELRRIDVDGGTDVGSAVSHAQLGRSPEIRRFHPALAEAAATVGGIQTQNVGTIGGNIVNASPAADLAPALLVANASVTLASRSRRREMPLQDFLLGRRSTSREPDEIVTRVSLEKLPPRSGETYLKVGRRRAMEVAVVGVAVRLTFDLESRVSDARIAVCSAAPTPFRATEAERRLIGSALDAAAVAEASELLRVAASPIDDARATAAYRARVLPPLLVRAVDRCLAGAEASETRGHDAA